MWSVVEVPVSISFPRHFGIFVFAWNPMRPNLDQLLHRICISRIRTSWTHWKLTLLRQGPVMSNLEIWLIFNQFVNIQLSSHSINIDRKQSQFKSFKSDIFLLPAIWSWIPLKRPWKRNSKQSGIESVTSKIFGTPVDWYGPAVLNDYDSNKKNKNNENTQRKMERKRRTKKKHKENEAISSNSMEMNSENLFKRTFFDSYTQCDRPSSST